MVKNKIFGVALLLVFCLLFSTACVNNRLVSNNTDNQGNIQNQEQNSNEADENGEDTTEEESEEGDENQSGLNEDVGESEEENSAESDVDDEQTENGADVTEEDTIGPDVTEEDTSESDDADTGTTEEDEVVQDASKENVVFLISKEYIYSGENNLTYVKSYLYNENGLLIEYSNDHVILNNETCMYEYDELGRRVKAIYYYDKEKSVGYGMVTIFEFDENDRVIKQYTYYENEPERIVEPYTYSYIFDDAGRLICQERSDGKKIENIYDEKGLLIKEIQYGNEYIYEYDENDILLKVTLKPGGSGADQVFEYDSDGNLIKKTIKNFKNNEFTYTYEFDQYGNMTKCTVFLNGEYYEHSEYEYIEYTP